MAFIVHNFFDLKEEEKRNSHIFSSSFSFSNKK
jgi:hypothetical protein